MRMMELVASANGAEQRPNNSTIHDDIKEHQNNELIMNFCEQFDELLQYMTSKAEDDMPIDVLKRKQERYKIERRRLKRKEERRRRRLRKADAKMECFNLDIDVDIVIDLSFMDAMNEKELSKLIRQMGRVWGVQKRYIGLKTTLLSPCSKFLEEGRRVLTGFDSFQWSISYSNIKEYSNKPLVYLSPDASVAPLEDVCSSVVYVIGGLVDESGVGSLSKYKAELLGIEVRRFPIVEYMKRADHGTFNLMLTVNQAVEVLARYAYCKRWDQTLAAVVPKRYGYVPIAN